MNLAQYVEEFLLCWGVDNLDEEGHSSKVSLGDSICYFCVVFGSLFRPQGSAATTSWWRDNSEGCEGLQNISILAIVTPMRKVAEQWCLSF